MGNEKAAEAFKKLQNAYEVISWFIMFFPLVVWHFLSDNNIISFIGLTWFLEAKSIWWWTSEGGAAKLFP